MYYILNETNQIIAVDSELLTLCGLSNIDELQVNIILERIVFGLNGDTINILVDKNTSKFRVQKISLSSMLGKLTIVNVLSEKEAIKSKAVAMDLDDEPSEDFLSLMDDDFDTDSDDSISFDDNIKLDEDTDSFDLPLIDSNPPLPEVKTEDTRPILVDVSKISKEIGISEKDYHSFLHAYIETSMNLKQDLMGSDVSKKSSAISTLSHLSDVLHLPVVRDIIIKINEASVSDDQDGMIEEFYTTLSRISISEIAQNEKPELDIFGEKEEEESMDFFEDTPSNDSGVDMFDLSAPLDDVDDSEDFFATPSDDSDSDMDLFGDIEESEDIDFASDVVDFNLEPEPVVFEPEPEPEPVVFEPEPEPEPEPVVFEPEPEPVVFEPEPEPEPVIAHIEEQKSAPLPANSFGTISLDGIKPIHFDFQLEEAANDLSLPVELIEEFVHDFIDQAHIETVKMLEAYENGDLVTIQKIGHLLKGASSNLRINPLADTLYHIQFCEEPENLEDYIVDYWAHLLSFENQLKVLSK